MLKSDGTMHCVIKTIMLLIQRYMNTKQGNASNDQDTRSPKATDGEMMQKWYMSKVGFDNHLDQLSPDVSEALIDYHLCKDICAKFDAVMWQASSHG